MQYQLSYLKNYDKTLDFTSLNQTLKKNILRLLAHTNISPKEYEEQEHQHFIIYFSPLSWFVLIWNIVYILLFYIVELQISLELAFGPTFIRDQLQLQNNYLPLYITILVYNVADIFVSFFKGYYAFGRGKVVDKSSEIVSHYLKTQFYFDVIFILVYIIPTFGDLQGLNFLQLIAAGVLWIKKFKYQAEIVATMQYYPTARVIFMLVILFIDVLMIGNYGACLFVGMDILLYNAQYYGSNTAYYWLSNNTSYPISLINGPWYYQYIYAQEFSTGTLSTLAPGPFAKNPIQAIYAIIIMIFFMVLASYVGQVLIQIVFIYTQRRVFHEDNIISFDNFMQLKSVQKGIRNRIYNFFELIWEVQLKMESKEQQNMIDKLPNYLKEELLLEIGFTKSIYFLKYLPHEKILNKKISMKIERMTIDSNTCIFQTKKTTHYNYKNRNLFFIKEGLAKFYIDEYSLKKHEEQQDILKKMGKEIILNLSNVDRVIGLYEFITGQDYSICCKSIDLCLIQKLSIDNFMQIVNELQIWEQFKELQHQTLIQQDYKRINKLCVLCQEPHIEAECPEIFFRKKVQETKSTDEMFGKPHERRPKKRRQLKSKKIVNVQAQKNANHSEQQNFLIQKLFKPLNLSKLIIDITRMEAINHIEIIEEVKIYRNYYNGYNLV